MQIDGSLFQLFLIKNRRLPLGKIGTVVLEQEPAFHDYTNHVIRPVREVLHFSPKTEPALQEEFEQFAGQRGIDKTGVAALLGQIKEQLTLHKRAVLAGIGTLKIEDSVYKLIGEEVSQDYLPAVTARAVIHEGDVHEVKVGEEVHSSEEMKALLAAKKTKDYWWVYALILLIVAAGAILYYLYGDRLK